MRASVARDPRMRLLSRRLGGPPSLAAAVGYVELLVHLTSEHAPDGGIGRLSDDEIEAALDWPGSPGALVGALVGTGWLAEHPDARLVVSDWPSHAADWVHARLAHAREFFLGGAAPRLAKIANRDREALRDYYARTCAHGPRRDCSMCSAPPADDTSTECRPTVGRRRTLTSSSPLPIPISESGSSDAEHRTQESAAAPQTRARHDMVTGASQTPEPEARRGEPDGLLDELREFAAAHHPEVPQDMVTRVYDATMDLAARKRIPRAKLPALLRRELFRVAARRADAAAERGERR